MLETLGDVAQNRNTLPHHSLLENHLSARKGLFHSLYGQVTSCRMGKSTVYTLAQILLGFSSERQLLELCSSPSEMWIFVLNQIDEGSKVRMSHGHEFGGKTGLRCYFVMLWEARLVWLGVLLVSNPASLADPSVLEMSATAQVLPSHLPHITFQCKQTASCCRSS